MQDLKTLLESSLAALGAMALVTLTPAVCADDVCGDLNGDGECDTTDAGILLVDFGCNDGDCPGDLDGDGDTDQADLAWWAIGFHTLDVPGPCQPLGTGTIELSLTPVDNTDVSPGDDPLQPEFHGGVTHFTFDLMAEIVGTNDWTTQASILELVAVDISIFEHYIGGNFEPNPNLFTLYPSLAYDSFYASPPTHLDGPHPAFAKGPNFNPPMLSAIWFDTPWDEDVIAIVQRITLVIDENSGMVPAALPDDCSHDYAVLAHITTDATSSATGADFLHREFLIVDLARSTCPGDVDMDGDVDQSDLGLLLVTYERPSDDALYDDRADFDCDGDVDQSDLGVLLAAYGGDC